MEEVKAKPGKFILMFGAISGVLSVLLQLTLFMNGTHVTASQDPTLNYISIPLGIVLALVAILMFRKANGGYLSLGQAIWISVGMALVSGTIGIIYMLVLANVLDPEYISKMAEFSIQQNVDKGQIPPEAVADSVEFTKKFWWAFVVGAVYIGGALVSAIVGLVIGLFTKKSRPDMI